jgi:hypothetical protein
MGLAGVAETMDPAAVAVVAASLDWFFKTL